MRANGTMRKLLVKIGKDFVSNQWGISFGGMEESFSLFLKEGFSDTVPFPGAELSTDDIHNLIVFLDKELKERYDEQSNLE
jgi:hypothetical protein